MRAKQSSRENDELMEPDPARVRRRPILSPGRPGPEGDFDYADCFELRLTGPDGHSAEGGYGQASSSHRDFYGQ